jgi:hypothetical protein
MNRITTFEFKDLSNHNGDWFNPVDAPVLFFEALAQRKLIIQIFNNTFDLYNKPVNPWAPFAWFNKTQDSSHDSLDDHPKFNIIEFINMMGGTSKSIDPSLFQLITLEPIGQLLDGNYFSTKNMLSKSFDQIYIVYLKPGTSEVGFSFSFGEKKSSNSLK